MCRPLHGALNTLPAPKNAISNRWLLYYLTLDGLYSRRYAKLWSLLLFSLWLHMPFDSFRTAFIMFAFYYFIIELLSCGMCNHLERKFHFVRHQSHSSTFFLAINKRCCGWKKLASSIDKSLDLNLWQATNAYNQTEREMSVK